MTSVIVDILPEKDGVTKVRFRVREATDESREAIDTLMNIIMGKHSKRAGYVNSTTVILEAMTGNKDDSSK